MIESNHLKLKPIYKDNRTLAGYVLRNAQSHSLIIFDAKFDVVKKIDTGGVSI